MFQRISLFIAVAMLLTACAGEAATETTSGPSGPRALAQPDVDTTDAEPADDTTDAVEREVDAAAEAAADPEVNPGCAAITEMMIGPDAETFYEGEFEEAMVLTHDAFSMFGPHAVEIALDFATAYDEGDIDGVAAIYQQMDDVSLEPCGFPGGGAFFALPGAVAYVKFCEVSAAIGEDEPDEFSDSACADLAKTYPTELPCFEATGFTWADLSSGGIPWEIVDCTSGEPVRWDHASASWIVA